LELERRVCDINEYIFCLEDNYLIIAGCTDGCVYVWDSRWPDDPLRTLSHGYSLMPPQAGVRAKHTDTGIRFLSWGYNGTRLYSRSSDRVLKVWDVTRSEQDTLIKDLVTVDLGIMAGAFSPDYSKLILSEVYGSVNVLDVGRDNCTMKDVERLRYISYAHNMYDQDAMDSKTTYGVMAEQRKCRPLCSKTNDRHYIYEHQTLVFAYGLLIEGCLRNDSMIRVPKRTGS
jgi:hypothetical protein